MKIVVIGATSGIAEHCCRMWAVEGADFVLMARDTRSATLAEPEFHDPVAIKAFADATIAEGPVDIVLIAHGWMPLDQHKADLATAEQILQVNAVSPVLFAEAFAGP